MNIDYGLLKQQRKFLMEYPWRDGMPDEVEGILNLLDNLLDDAPEESVEIALRDAYDAGGAAAVAQYVKARFPEWGWHYCTPCEAGVPTWPTSYGEELCAICWTPKGEK